MALIPCTDFYTEDPPIVPTRIKRTNPDAIRDRWANFVYAMDLSVSPDDDKLGNQLGAWSLWDLPVTHTAQYVDSRGNDFVVVAILDRVYVLDWKVYRDEWRHNSYAPIYRMITVGPIPSAKEEVPKGYDLGVLKRFREWQFSLRDAPEAGAQSKWRISVGEYDNEDATYKTTMRAARKRMRLPVAVKGSSFTVRMEHAANEPIHIGHWLAKWDMLGRPIAHTVRTA